MRDTNGLYMAGFRAGEQVARRDIAKALDRGIWIGFAFGIAIGTVIAIAAVPVVGMWV